MTITDFDINLLNEMAGKAKKAVFKFQTMKQKEVDKIVEAVAKVAIRNREKYAREAFDETKMGVYEDKIIKNFLVVESNFNYMRGKKTVGIIKEDEYIWEVAGPVGVIAAFTPCTNPTATAIFKILVALKTCNTIIFSPHPRALNCTLTVINDLYKVAIENGAPEDCIQCLDHVSIDLVNALMRHKDVYINWATGGKALTKAAFSSGKPSFSGGAGNVPSYIEKTADIKSAVYNILMDKMFDNSATCTSTKGLIVDKEIYEEVVSYLKLCKAYILTNEETIAIEKILINRENNMINADCVAISAYELAKKANIKVVEDTKVLVAPISGDISNYRPIESETITSIFKLYACSSSEEGIRLCERLVRHEGLGHSANIFTNNDTLVRRFAEIVPAGRLNVNMPPTLGSASDVYAPRIPTFSVSCGTGANNLTMDNLNYKNFLNIQTVAKPRSNLQPFRGPKQIFSDISIFEYFKNLSVENKRVFVVTDQGVSKLPYFEKLVKELQSKYKEVTVFDKAVPDPDMNVVNKGLCMIKEAKADVIIAIGGGSSIDTAKVIRVCYDIPNVSISDLCLPFMDIGKKIVQLKSEDIKTKLICIPTTCGTGSETTSAAVVTDPETHVKYPIFDFNTMYADVVLLDKEMVATLPPKLVAETGLDALVHSIEAYLSIARTVETDALALRSAVSIYKNIRNAVAGDVDAKFELLKAASNAGLAISNAFVGVNHALGHQIGGMFGIPHGASLAVFLPHVIKYNSEMPYKFQGLPTYSRWEAPSRYAKIAREFGLKAETKEKRISLLIEEIEKLLLDLKIPTKIKDYGITKEEYMSKVSLMASNALLDLCVLANPRQVMMKDLLSFYKNIYE